MGLIGDLTIFSNEKNIDKIRKNSNSHLKENIKELLPRGGDVDWLMYARKFTAAFLVIY